MINILWQLNFLTTFFPPLLERCQINFWATANSQEFCLESTEKWGLREIPSRHRNAFFCMSAHQTKSDHQNTCHSWIPYVDSLQKMLTFRNTGRSCDSRPWWMRFSCYCWCWQKFVASRVRHTAWSSAYAWSTLLGLGKMSSFSFFSGMVITPLRGICSVVFFG